MRFGGRVWLVSSPIACRPRWLGPVASFGAVSGRRSPSSASARSRRTRLFRLRLGVLARDRRVLPKQSAEPGTAGGPFEATPARPFSPPPGSPAHAAANRGPDEVSPGQAPLMRFRPLQHIPAATRCVRGNRPPDDPATTFPPVVARAWTGTSTWRSSVRFSAVQNRCDGARGWRTLARGAFRSNRSPVLWHRRGDG